MRGFIGECAVKANMFLLFIVTFGSFLITAGF